MKHIGLIFLLTAMAAGAYAQRPRAVDTSAAKNDPNTAPAPAPQTMRAKYEGGVFGYNKTMEGTLSFDDTNQRLVFRNKQKKEVFFVPYSAVTSTFADTQKRRPTAATVASNIPYFGLPLGFIKTKVRYLTLQYNDPDTHVSGVTSFRLDTRQLVESAVVTLANKAGLIARGEVYVRKRDSEAVKTTP